MGDKLLMGFVICTKCKCKIPDGEMRANYPTGTECIKCAEKPKKKPKFTNIAGYKIPTKKLEEYRDVVEYTRRAALRGQTNDEPMIVINALNNRVKIHKEIFAIAGIDHDSTSKKAMKIRDALDTWLEKNVMTPSQVKGLV